MNIICSMYRFSGLIISLMCFPFSCGKKEAVPSAASLPRPVKVVKVEALGSIKRQYTGVVEAKEFSVLAFKLPGTLKEMNVQEGQRIRQGQVIARIKPRDYRLQYNTAKANYETARSIYERNKRLQEADAIALQNLEIAEADYVRANSALNIARRTLDYTTLTAPFDGFIEKKYTENFEEIQAGQAIVRLVNPENIEIHFVLPETNIQLLKIPRKIYVEFDSQKGKLFTTNIKDYIYASDGSGIPVTLTITDAQFALYRKNVYPGFSCKVTWETDNMISDKFIIPASALQTHNQQEYVWLVDPVSFKIQRHAITTSRLAGNILVESGLSSHDIIVTAGIPSLHEGQTVRPMYKQN